MGCWNKTCGLTRLHINVGEPVYVFLIEQNTTHDRCYSTAFWRPCLLPWYANYDDHGAGEKNKGIGVPLVVEGLKKSLVEMPQGENQFHDIPVSKEDFSLEKFYEAVHEGRMALKSIFGSQTEVEFVMMKRSCVDSLLNSWVFEDHYYNREKGKVEYDKYDYDDLIDDVPGYVAALASLVEDAKDSLIEIMRISRRPQELGYQRLERHINNDSINYSQIFSLHNTLVDFITEGKTVEAEYLIKDFLKGCVVDAVMESTRRLWMPGGHEGSQNDDLDSQEFLLRITQEEIDRERRKREQF